MGSCASVSSKAWVDYIERSTNEENNWDKMQRCSRKRSRDEVSQALNEMNTGKAPGIIRLDCC